MRESIIRQEIAGYRRGLVREGEVTCEVGRTTHLQDRTVGQSEWDEGKGLGSEERLERREVGKTEEDTSAARVCNERGAGEIEARAEGDVVVRACAGGKLGGGGLTCAGGWGARWRRNLM